MKERDGFTPKEYLLIYVGFFAFLLLFLFVVIPIFNWLIAPKLSNLLDDTSNVTCSLCLPDGNKMFRSMGLIE